MINEEPNAVDRYGEAAVTVGIPVYRGPDNLEQLLGSLARESQALQQMGWALEVIVLDDGSPEPSRSQTVSIVNRSRRGLDVRLEQFAVNRGRSAARNQIVEMARGAYLFWVDADDSLLEGRVSTHLRGHLKLEAPDDMISVCGYRVIAAGHVENREVVFPEAITRQHVANVEHYPTKGYPALWTMCIPTRVARDVPFSEALSYAEDTDFTIRALLSGAEIRSIGGMPLYEYFVPSERPEVLILDDMVTLFRRNRAFFDLYSGSASAQYTKRAFGRVDNFLTTRGSWSELLFHKARLASENSYELGYKFDRFLKSVIANLAADSQRSRLFVRRLERVESKLGMRAVVGEPSTRIRRRPRGVSRALARSRAGSVARRALASLERTRFERVAIWIRKSLRRLVR